ncbi:hypothetical protein DOTSEDRAFT_75770 [Dothistroma septosporum NZE10]|uniref:pyridoxal kinase n=1 Tax=Dothistroma septosporum (strain NZE10 / CBS 128990) TaxID=675120 RepID=N1PBP6_DOTSN|nr:hypothetical protein DOTSEDRAFT_75770 [Dothistroma septosporum NZE10]
MATFCMQTLGCEVSAIHTVNYSNHVAYKTFKGRKTPPEEVAEIYDGLKNARLDHFDMMLSGYCPTAAMVEQVGKIGRDAKFRASTKPGSFFWVLDPVMGDNGRIYVAEETVPAYKSLLTDADLILPNQFEAELLSDVKIHDLRSMEQAISKLHQDYTLPHVLITSIRLPTTGLDRDISDAQLSIIGSTATSTNSPRLFRITVPALPVFFSGTGDMFAALLVARLRQAASKASLLNTASWRSPDDVAAQDLPLAKATEMVLASMHAVLKDTTEHYEAVKKGLEEETELNEGTGKEGEEEREMKRHLVLTRAAEVRVVRNTKALREPPNVGEFQAEAVRVEQ